MDKHSKRSASIFRYPVLIAFTLFFAGLFVLDLVTPDRAYSELENTTLSQRPSLSSVSLMAEQVLHGLHEIRQRPGGGP